MSHSAAVLFVDDEPRILNGLRRMLRPMRHEWDMAFATGGVEALQTLTSRPFDVIVSDMRMPGMDGVELLGEVRTRHPQIVRLALSGQASKDTVFRSVGVVHQYLAKPCGTETLKTAVTRVCELRSLVAHAELRDLLTGMTALPSLPSLYAKVMDQVRSPEASMNEIGLTISQDLGLSARALQLVSSAFYGRPAHTLSPYEATVFLGVDIVRALALSEAAFSELDPGCLGSLPVESLWRHSRAVAECAKAIAEAENSEADVIHQAHVAGLLHDVGKVVFAAEFPGEYASMLAAPLAGEAAVAEAERQKIGAAHAEVGAYLMGLWGLPEDVVKAMVYHHTPGKSPTTQSIVLTATHVGNVLARQHGAAGDGDSPAEIDPAYLAELGLTGRLDIWRESCRNAMSNRETAHV